MKLTIDLRGLEDSGFKLVGDLEKAGRSLAEEGYCEIRFDPCNRKDGFLIFDAFLPENLGKRYPLRDYEIDVMMDEAADALMAGILRKLVIK